jgi:hypothetical protein
MEVGQLMEDGRLISESKMEVRYQDGRLNIVTWVQYREQLPGRRKEGRGRTADTKMRYGGWIPGRRTDDRYLGENRLESGWSMLTETR